MTQGQFRRATITNSALWIVVLIALEVLRRIVNG